MITLKVEVPIACFRRSRARDYIETYPVPPPSTVYGMLLSLIGETNRYRHCGTRLAIALTRAPQMSTTVRTVHRFKRRAVMDPRNMRPDYQQLLTGVRFFVWIDSQFEQTSPKLSERIQAAFTHPSLIERFGGLSLGESHDLVDSVSLVSEEYSNSLYWLIQKRNGSLTLPYWVNHIGLPGTFWNRYELQWLQQECPPDDSWTAILASQESNF